MKSVSNRLELNNDWNYEKVDNKITKLDVKNLLRVPFVSATAKLDGSFNDKLVSYDASAQYGKHVLASDLTWKHDEKVLGDWDLKLGGKANVHTLNLVSVKVVDASTKKSTIDTKLTTSAGANVQVKSECSGKLTLDDADISVDGSAVFAQNQEPYK